jgi:DNA repair protein RadC
MNDLANLPDMDLLAMLGINGVGRDLKQLFGFCTNHVQQPDAAYAAAQNTLAAAKELYVRAIACEMSEKPFFCTSPGMVKKYLIGRLGHLEHEQFWCLWLNSQHSLIMAEEISRGTLNQTAVYPRELVKRALQVNAAAVIVAHNHPTGTLQPSTADKQMTDQLKAALGLIDIRVLDHLIVAGTDAVSFVEKGLI